MTNTNIVEITKPILMVLSGPSGSGKTTIRNRILDEVSAGIFSVSVTTRPRRDHELNNLDYSFISHEDFEKKIESDSFIEYENVHGNYYGTLKAPIENAVNSRCLVLFDLDVYGGMRLKEFFKDTVLVYLTVKDTNTLRERLTQRGTDNVEEIERRLGRINLEDKLSSNYGHIIVNEDVEETIEKIKKILIDHQK